MSAVLFAAVPLLNAGCQSALPPPTPITPPSHVEQLTCSMRNCVDFVTPPGIPEALAFHSYLVKGETRNESTPQLVSIIEGSLAKVRYAGRPYYRILDNNTKLAGVPDAGVLRISVNEQIATEAATGTSCPLRKLTINATLRLANNAGKVVASETETDTETTLRCSFGKKADANAKPTAGQQAGNTASAAFIERTDAELADAARKEMSRKLLAHVAIRIEQRPHALITKPYGITSEANKAEFESAVAFGVKNQLDEACPKFSNLRDSEPDSYAVTYNLGYCKLATGHYVEAAQLCRQASSQNSMPVAEIGACKKMTEFYWRDDMNLNPPGGRPSGAAASAASGASRAGGQ